MQGRMRVGNNGWTEASCHHANLNARGAGRCAITIHNCSRPTEQPAAAPRRCQPGRWPAARASACRAGAGDQSSTRHHCRRTAANPAGTKLHPCPAYLRTTHTDHNPPTHPATPHHPPVCQLIAAQVPPNILLLQPPRQACKKGGSGTALRAEWGGAGRHGGPEPASCCEVKQAADQPLKPEGQHLPPTLPLPNSSPSTSHSSSGVAARSSTPNHWRARLRAIAQRAATAVGASGCQMAAG